MPNDILIPDLIDFDKPCIMCNHYYKSMSRYSANLIIQHYLNDKGIKLEYEFGQKFCVKNHDFTYFNLNCMNFSKID